MINRKKNLEVPIKSARVITIFPGEKNFLKFEEKKSNFLFQRKMPITPSIFNILVSSFLRTPPFLGA